MGPEHPDTIGLMLMGFLCIFLRKYILCVRVLVSLSLRKHWVVSSKELCAMTLLILLTRDLV